ncbi:MAG: glyoxalase [bacterium]|nr:glyoxalase [Deltaproteobacteria bacterium]MCP4908823.1 glyoxalase [bacterium]
MDIRSLGYVGVEGPNPKDWLSFATRICGLMPAPLVPGEDPSATRSEDGMSSDGSVYLKMDPRQWRLAAHPAETGGLRYLGFELAGRGAFEKALDEARQQGLTVTPGTPEECMARGVHRMAHFADPAGHRIELFISATADSPFESPTGVSSFLTGSLGMGHIGLLVPDLEAGLNFYLDILGFEESDYFEIGPGMAMHFLRCNARHHSLAIGRVGDFKALHHLMLEVPNIDEVGQIHDRATAASIPISTQIGRHANDRMISFYMKSPFGFDIEIGCEGLLVGEDWVSQKLIRPDVWGHAGLTAEVGGAD